MIRFTILGCGSSLGVPRIDGNFGNCNPHYSKHLSRILSESTFSMKIELLEIRPKDTEYDCAFFHKQLKIAIKYLLSSGNSC